MDERRKPKITTPEKPQAGWTRGAKAQWWRQHVMNMTREELSLLVSYSVDTIWLKENCQLRQPTLAWKRYEVACSAAHRVKFPLDTTPFNWGIPNARTEAGRS